MPVLLSSRLVLLVGETLPLRKILPASSTYCLHSSARCLSQVEPQHVPLTPLSIGLNNENETRKNDKVSRLEQLDSSSLSSKGRTKTNGTYKTKVGGAAKKQQIESAPFAAKSFSELGLPHLLLERLENEGRMRGQNKLREIKYEN